MDTHLQYLSEFEHEARESERLRRELQSRRQEGLRRRLRRPLQQQSWKSARRRGSGSTNSGRLSGSESGGTRPRGATPEEDSALAENLLNDPKERAEHLMLLDLGRNDVGRVAKVGSVKVTEQFIVEFYSHVMHIASNVEGELADDCDAIDALLAGFPAGTVSGAPKVRAMEIIDQLELERRGVYAGCIGYFGADGDMDTCIALRTAVIKDQTLYVQAGCGVVADSDPEYEYQETVNKAQALVRAAEEAEAFAVNNS